LQKLLSRKKKGSKNRAKARAILAKQHMKVQNQRTDFHHKLSRSIALNYFRIFIEDLRVKSMLKSHLSKYIIDASWLSFIQMLSYKAVACGGELIKIDPRNTSRKCSNCGEINDIGLSVRTFNCKRCGLSLSRDLNAAINIQSRDGPSRTYTPVETFPIQERNLLQEKSMKQELYALKEENL